MTRDILFDNIPQSMQECPQWVVWKIEQRGGKDTKVPYQATLPSWHASSTDEKTWASFEEARRTFEMYAPEFDGIGFVLTPPWVGIDIDPDRDENGDVVRSVFMENGQLRQDVQEMVDSISSYTEISPGGHGLHSIAETERPIEITAHRRKGDPREIYTSGRFFTVTGNHLSSTPREVMVRHGEILALVDFMEHGERDPEAAKRAVDQLISSGEVIPIGCYPSKSIGRSPPMSDDEIISLAERSENGIKFTLLFFEGDITEYKSHSEADLALCGILAFFTQEADQIDRIFRSSELMRKKWDEKRGLKTYGAMTIERALSGSRDHYTGKKPSSWIRNLSS